MKVEMANLDRQSLHVLLGNVLSPLPIALISTVGENGNYNAAPFSCVAPVCWKPPIICLSMGVRNAQKKDTWKNIEFSRDFVINIMDDSLIVKTVQTSADYPSDVDEIRAVGLNAQPADIVRSPLIVEAQVSLECQVLQNLELGEGENLRGVFFGKVVLAHIKDGLWAEGTVQPSLLRAVGRVGNAVYCTTKDIFELRPRPI